VIKEKVRRNWGSRG